jgi:hypothetical protein
LPGHRNFSEIDGGDDEDDDAESGTEATKDDEGEEGDPSEEMVPVKHVAFADAENALGPPSLDDRHCYLCDKILGASESSLHPEIVALIEMIASLRRSRRDKVGIAKSVKEWFEENIMGPANQAAAEASERREQPQDGRRQTEGSASDCDGGALLGSREKRPQGVSPWTLRSIYYHITDHDNSLGNQIDQQIDYLKRMQDTIEENGMWCAPAKRVKTGAVKKSDLKPDSKTGEFLMKVAGKLQQMYAIRVRLTSCETLAKTRGMTGQARGAGSGSGGGGGGVNSMSVSTLLGGMSVGGLPTSIDPSSRKRPWVSLHDT